MSTNGKVSKFNAEGCNRAFRELLRKGNIANHSEYTLHDVRRGLPQDILRRGGDTSLIQWIGGWASKSAPKYYIVEVEAKRKVFLQIQQLKQH